MTIKKIKITYNFGKTVEELVKALQLFVTDVHDDISQLNANIVTTLPIAEKDKRGSFLILQASSTDDKLYFCILNSSGGYTWKQVQFV